MPPVLNRRLFLGQTLASVLTLPARGDVVVALSASGETEEILRLLATLKRKGDALVSFAGTDRFFLTINNHQLVKDI